MSHRKSISTLRQPPRGGGSRTCYKCGEEGHMARECPSSRGGAGGGGTTRCYKCGKDGHRARECPGCRRGISVEANQDPAGGNDVCSKTTRALEEAAEAAVDLLLVLNAAKRVPWKKNNKVLKMAERLLPLLKEKRNSIRQATVRALQVVETKNQVRQEGHSSRNRANVHRQGSQGAKAVPPQMLKGPVVVTGNGLSPSVKTFQQLKLKPQLMQNVRKRGFMILTPVQKFASPQLLAGRDVLCCAHAGPGSGKTSFLLATMNALLDRKLFQTISTCYPSRPQAIIVVPTEELATEIVYMANMLAIGTRLRIQVLSGGASISSPQTKLLIGCNVLVATTERLKNFVRADIVDLSKVRYFFIDEADNVLEKELPGDITEIVAKLPPKKDRISGIFSSTLSKKIQLVAEKILNNHVYIGTADAACETIQHEID